MSLHHDITSTEQRDRECRLMQQRAARLEREAQEATAKRQHAAAALAKAKERAANPHDASAVSFWDNIDTSAGPDACHPWTGHTKWNHEDHNIERFKQGRFTYAGCQSMISTRVLCFASFGVEVPAGVDVTPLCGDHLCHNIRHMTITPHGFGADAKARKAVPAAEFFCHAVPSAD